MADGLKTKISVIHNYVDGRLRLEDTLRLSMLKMSPKQFERVLHPIFEEDELTLIVAGAVLGFAAGLVQQGFATGALSFKKLREKLNGMASRFKSKRRNA